MDTFGILTFKLLRLLFQKIIALLEKSVLHLDKEEMRGTNMY